MAPMCILQRTAGGSSIARSMSALTRSGSPSLETHPLNKYAKDGWNLNNMPILSESCVTGWPAVRVELITDCCGISGQIYRV